MRQFKSRIEKICNDDEKMAYQEQFTTGEAHRIVTGYSFLPSDVGCKAAIKQLSRRYGNAEVIANSYVQQVLQWPSIKAEDPKSIYAFSIILKECQAATRCIRTMNILEHTENLRQILKKLPVYRHDRWRRTVQELHKNGKVVKFSNLVDFVELEAMKLNDPVWGRNALSCLQKREQKYSKVMTAATDASEGLQCWGCDGPHRIKECPKLKESNLTERRSLVYQVVRCTRHFTITTRFFLHRRNTRLLSVILNWNKSIVHFPAVTYPSYRVLSPSTISAFPTIYKKYWTVSASENICNKIDREKEAISAEFQETALKNRREIKLKEKDIGYHSYLHDQTR
ncbi:uncharacterized protein LOC135696373 [Rhopilema esculentum]|uniref:uncharacterized protein LOC135696373 n=1 Tax=Rhopilema esculentum TaxID=499914 RepID=UPI0031E27421